METVTIGIGPRDGDRYRVSLTDSCGQEVASETMPVSLDVDETVRTLLEVRATDAELREIGRQMHDALLAGEVGCQWRALCVNRVRTLLHIEDPSLRRLPWELLAAGDRLLATLRDQPIVRTASGYLPQGLTPVTWPLQILVIVGISEGEYGPGAGTVEELDRLQEALGEVVGLVDVEYVRCPSAADLAQACQAIRPHLVHVIAHGDLDEAGSPCLLIDDATRGERWRWTAAAIAGDLPTPRPRLLVLNACRSAEANATAREEEIRRGHQASWGVTDELLEIGVAAVIGMQGDIAGDAAAGFTAAFYRELAKGGTVDVAVTTARHTMSKRVARGRADWALPALVTRVHPEQVLSKSPTLPLPLRTLIEKQLYGFIDRSEIRRSICQRMRLSSDAEEVQASLITVDGPQQIGKTRLLQWCVNAAKLNGFNVAYVDVRGPESRARPFMDVLGLIAYGLASSGTHAARNRDAFDGWLSEVDDLLGKAGRIPASDQDHRYHRRFPVNPPERAEEAIFDSFGRALQKAGADEGVVLALDHAGEDTVERGSWSRMLVELLLKPVALDQLAPTRMILAASPEYRDALVTAVGAPESVQLDRFPPSRSADFVRLYLRHYHVEADVIEVLVQTIARLGELGKEKVFPTDLKGLLEWV